MTQTVSPPQILLCTSSAETAMEEVNVAASPIACLDKVMSTPFDLVAVSFHQVTLKERSALVELCSVLRKSLHTADTLLLCILRGRHRELLAALKKAGLEHVLLLEALRDSLESRLRLFAENRSGGASITEILAELCPYITYVPISRRREMLYCRAYYNRLVLGPYLLSSFCETPGHIDCPYYREPRLAPPPVGNKVKRE